MLRLEATFSTRFIYEDMSPDWASIRSVMPRASKSVAWICTTHDLQILLARLELPGRISSDHRVSESATSQIGLQADAERGSVRLLRALRSKDLEGQSYTGGSHRSRER